MKYRTGEEVKIGDYLTVDYGHDHLQIVHIVDTLPKMSFYGTDCSGVMAYHEELEMEMFFDEETLTNEETNYVGRGILPPERNSGAFEDEEPMEEVIRQVLYRRKKDADEINQLNIIIGRPIKIGGEWECHLRIYVEGGEFLYRDLPLKHASPLFSLEMALEMVDIVLNIQGEDGFNFYWTMEGAKDQVKEKKYVAFAGIPSGMVLS